MMRPPRTIRLSRTRRAAALAGAVMLAGVHVTAAAADPVIVVEVQDYRFTPATVTIKAGTTVVWVNKEKRTSHSVIFLGPEGFESERFFPDERWQRRFDKPGEYAYSCGPHPEMKGSVVVE